MRFVPVVFYVVLLVVASLSDGWAASPPGQPEKGPGGRGEIGGSITRHFVGQPYDQAYLFHGEEAGKQKRPVVIFLHGWGANNPLVYGGWIEHLVRRNWVVLFPRYQEPNRTKMRDANERALATIRAGLAALKQNEAANADLSQVFVIGHLAGATVGINLAATLESGLPPIRLVMLLMPGGAAKDAKDRGVPLKDLGLIPSDTLLLTLIGDREHIASDRTAKRFLREARQVLASHKLALRSASDDYGFPVLSATLASPASPKADYDAPKIAPVPPLSPLRQRWTAELSLTGEQTVLAAQIANNGTDTLDYHAYWKSFDLAFEAAMTQKDFSRLRTNPALTDMGRWSDGWPVKRLGIGSSE
jgi:acetyl esterase/lipase